MAETTVLQHEHAPDPSASYRFVGNLFLIRITGARVDVPLGVVQFHFRLTTDDWQPATRLVIGGPGALPQSKSAPIAAGGVQHGGQLVPAWGAVRPSYVTLGGQRGAPEPDTWPDGHVLLHWIDDLGLEQFDVADCLEADAAAVDAYLGESLIDWDQIIDWIRLADVPM
jgi:hypothetical protein